MVLRQKRYKKKINVLHLLLTLETGGAERIVTSIVEKNDSDSLNYKICCLDSKGGYAEDLESKGHDIILLPRKPGIDWSIPWKLAHLSHREDIDIIHAHGETQWFYGILASIIRCGRTKCMTTIHGYGGGDRQQLENSRLWTMLSLFSLKVVVVSELLLNEIRTQSFLPRKNMMAIINGVDISEINSAEKQLRHQWSLEPGTKVLGIVSRLSAIKNHKLLLQALHRLLEMGKNVRLMIVGDGFERKSLELFSEKLGIREAVIFTGRRLDAISFFPLFDIFVLPSFSEGISMTILEAMASNTPVIASEVGGNREIITHGVNGFLFESENLDALVQTILHLLDNPGLARNAAQNARKKVESEYSFERMVSQYEEIYQSVVSQ